MKLISYNHINIIGKMVRLNSLILIFFLILNQKAIASNKGLTKINEEDKISSIKKIMKGLT